MCYSWGIISQELELHALWNIRADHASAIGVLEGSTEADGMGTLSVWHKTFQID